MPICPYGRCTMVNLCKGSHCVRKALEDAGWDRKPDGDIEQRTKPPQ
jgi:hypothetical protein